MYQDCIGHFHLNTLLSIPFNDMYNCFYDISLLTSDTTFGLVCFASFLFSVSSLCKSDKFNARLYISMTTKHGLNNVLLRTQ